MLKRIPEHTAYYVSLVAILSLSFLLAHSSFSREFQIGVIVATTFFYVLWGIMHHLINHDLHTKIVVEYVLIGVFGLTIIFFLLSTI
jgi:intracellular septation protein A